MATAPIRMGIIGCGGNMVGHVRRLVQHKEVDIVGLADPSAAGLAGMIEHNPAVAQVPTFTSHSALLDAIRPDAVEISTPHTLHYEHIMDSLAAGCHVLVEKPMVCEVAHAHEVIRRSTELGQVMLVSYQRHYEPQLRAIKQAIERDELGHIQYVTGLLNQDWYHNTRGKWRSQMALSGGGQLNDSGSHLLDFLLWATGLTVASVHCLQEDFDREVDINTAMSLRFTTGALGTISVLGHAPGGMWVDMTFYGSKGAIHYRTTGIKGQQPIVQLRRFHQPEPLPLSDLPPGSDPDTNFIDAIRGRDQVHSPATCGLRVAELTEAAWRSARTGQPAKVESVVSSQ